MTPPRQAHADLENDGAAPSTKRAKVSFQSLTPPGSMSSKDAARTVDVRSDSDDKAMPAISIPFKVQQQEPKCVTLGLDVEDERREGGLVVYPMEKGYGQNLDYKEMLGESSKGVPENAETKKALAYVMQGMKNGSIPMIKFYKKRDAAATATSESSASDKNVNAGSKALLPFDFMPKTPSSTRKGSSSILNKPIQNTGNGDKAATTPVPANATGATATPAAESSPVPAGSGWGGIFKKKPGEWRCNECACATNTQDDAKCLPCGTPKGCEAPKPSEDANTGSNEAEKKESGFSMASGSNIAFGASSATGGFTFGAPSSSSDKKDDFKSETGGFTFGATPSAASDKKDEAKPATGGFTFGAPSSSSDTKDYSSKLASGGFTFEATPSAPSDKKDEAKPATGEFTFGMPLAKRRTE